MSLDQEPPLPSRIPLVVGTTGHIRAVLELTDEERQQLLIKLRDEVFVPLLGGLDDSLGPTSFLSRFSRDKKPSRVQWRTGGAAHSSEPALGVRATPIRILSGLAEGADRLMVQAARAAAEHLGRPEGVELVAILPFSVKETRSHFEHPKDPEFDELLKFATSVRVAKDMRSDKEKKSGSEVGRSLQYALQGVAIARWSRLLVSVWNGEPFQRNPKENKYRGGTAHVIHMALTGEVTNLGTIKAARELERQGDGFFGFSRDTLDRLDPIPLVSVLPKETASPRIDYPARFSTDPAPYRRYLFTVLERISSFNRDSVELTAELSAARVDSCESLLPDSELDQLGKPEEELRHLFADASALATHFQGQAGRSYRWIYLTVFCAGAAFVAASHVFYSHTWQTLALAAYALLLMSAAFVHGHVQRRGLEWRHWDMRALSEAIRIQFAWRLLGFSSSASRYYLQRQRSELDWIRAGIEAAALKVVKGTPKGSEYQTSGDTSANERFKGLALATWVGGQYAYYRDNCVKRGAKAAQMHLLGSGLIGASFFATAVTLIRESHGPAALAASALGVAVVGAMCLLFLLRQKAHVAQQAAEVRAASKNAFFQGILGGGAFSLFAAFAGPPLASALPDGLLYESKHAWAVVSMVGPALVAALLHSYSLGRAFDEERERFHHMEGVYAYAIESLYSLLGIVDPPPLSDTQATNAELAALGPKLKSPEDPACRVLLRLGEESLIEHADWVLMHRLRPVDLPHAM